jgi:hypothetical protein
VTKSYEIAVVTFYSNILCQNVAYDEFLTFRTIKLKKQTSKKCGKLVLAQFKPEKAIESSRRQSYKNNLVPRLQYFPLAQRHYNSK